MAALRCAAESGYPFSRESGHEVAALFTGSRKNSTGGRPADDFELARFAAYLVAMNGDPNKAEVAAAQQYFAIRTREAETQPAPALTDDELIHRALEVSARRVAEQPMITQTYAERLRAAADQAERAELETQHRTLPDAVR